MNRLVRPVLVALVSAVLLVLAPAAQAHDQLLESSPADGATLETAPEAIELTFSGEIAQVGAQVAVTGGDVESPLDGAPRTEGVMLVQDLVTSTLRLLLGMGIAAAVGIPAGVLIGLHRPTRWASALPVQFVRMISPLSWAPVAVALLGVGSAPVVFLVAAAAIWPILLGTAAAVAAIDPRYVAVAHTLGANRREMLRTVLVPSVRPAVLQSIRLALGIAWVVLVPAEMLGVTSGLGYEILNARDRLAYDEMLVVILVIGVLGAAIDLLARLLLTPRRG